MTEKAETKGVPQWGYRLVDGEVEAKLFPEGRPSKGWQDTPAKLKRKG